MKISYAVTVCNELNEIKRLIEFLLIHKREEDEVVVFQDTKNFTDIKKEIQDYVCDKAKYINVVYRSGSFQEDFADWKNQLNGFCTGDYIFQIDADECPNENMMKYLPGLLEDNPEVDLFLVSRENIVDGLTQEDIDRWHWSVSKRSSDGAVIINWPDWQTRIYKKGLLWEGRVHERITGFKKYAKVPTTLFLDHIKDIDKQRRQNEHYDKILRNGN